MDRSERRKELGKWIKDRREQINMTQASLARNLGYDNAQIISNIERGVSAIPQKRIPDFAEALKSDPVELNFRVLSSSIKDQGTSKASDLALKYFPILQALESAENQKKDEILSFVKNKLDII